MGCNRGCWVWSKLYVRSLPLREIACAVDTHFVKILWGCDMKKIDKDKIYFQISFFAGGIYMLQTIFRERYDAVLAAHFMICGGLGVLIYAWKRTARMEHLANVLMILWAVSAILILHGSIGWTIYFTALIIVPSLVSIGMRLTKTRG